MDELSMVQMHEDSCKLKECLLKSQHCSWKGTQDQIKKNCLRDHSEKYCSAVLNLEMAKIIDGFATEFYLMKDSENMYHVGLYFDIVLQLLYISVQSVVQSKIPDRNMFLVLTNTKTKSNTVLDIKFEPLTSDENALDKSICLNYLNIKESVKSLYFVN